MDTSPPTDLVLDRPRRGTQAAQPALLYIGVVVLALVLLSVIWGIKKRLFSGHPVKSAATQEAPITPAVSNRESVERNTKEPDPAKRDTRQPERSQSASGGNDPATDGPIINFQPSTSSQGATANSAAEPVDPEIDLERKARDAPTTVRFETTPVKSESGNSTTSPLSPPEIPRNPTSSGSDPALERLIRSAQAMAGRQSEAAATDSKEQFAKSDTTPLAIERKAPDSEFVVSSGSKIQAVLTSNMSSQLPGSIQAMVCQNVFNSTCGQPGHGCYVEIPKGSKLLGTYNAQVSYAQDRVQVAWYKLIFPDQSFVDLGEMIGYGPEGTSGLHGKTNNHWKRIISGALLTSGISAGISLSQSRNNTPLSYPSTGQVAGASVGQGLGEVGNQIASKNVNIPPYNSLFIGQGFIVNINRDMLFKAPYEPISAESK